jgi:hypothetical protein
MQDAVIMVSFISPLSYFSEGNEKIFQNYQPRNVAQFLIRNLLKTN